MNNIPERTNNLKPFTNQYNQKKNFPATSKDRKKLKKLIRTLH